MGDRVLVERMSSGWHILQYDVFYWKTGLIGGCVLQEGIYLTGLFVLQEDTSYMRTSFTGGYVLWEAMCYMRACLTVGHYLQEYI